MSAHSIKRIASRTVIVLLVSVGLVGAAALTQGVKYLSVQSGSMVPTFSKGDLVVVTDIPAQRLAVGDVITFINPENNKQTITHRLQSVETRDGQSTGKVVTKGDANDAADRSIPTNAIIGKVSFSIPYLGFVFDFVRQPLGLLLLIYIPALSIVVGEIRKLAKYYKEQEPYVAIGHDPEHSKMAVLPQASAAKRTAIASASAVIAAVVIAVPVAHAALSSSVILGSTSLSTVSPAGYPLISEIRFSSTSGGSNGSSNVNVTVTNNNPQNATSGNATGNNAQSGNASNTSNTNITINVGGSTGTNQTSSQTVVIANPTASNLNLSGWKLSDNTTTRTIADGTSLAPGATFSYLWPTTGSLSRQGDRMILRDRANATIDALSWGNDSSQLNPPIATSNTTMLLKRLASPYDTNSAKDWSAI